MKSGLWRFCLGGKKGCFVYFLFLPIPRPIWMRSIFFFFSGLNMLYVDMWKSKQYFASRVLSRSFGSDKLIFNFYKQKLCFNLLHSSRRYEYSYVLTHASQEYVQCSTSFFKYLTCLTSSGNPCDFLHSSNFM